MLSQLKGKRKSNHVSLPSQCKQKEVLRFPSSAAHYYCFTQHERLLQLKKCSFKECSDMMKTFMVEWATLSNAERAHHVHIYKMQQEKPKHKIVVRDHLRTYNQKPYVGWKV
jgi:hypothetical protein